MARSVRAHHKASERVTNEHISVARRDLCEHGGELVDDSVKGSGTRRRVAPRQTCAIVRTNTRECRNLRLDDGPTERRGGNPGFEQHNRTALTRARGMQPMATNLNQHAWRREPSSLAPGTEALIERAKQKQREEPRQDTEHAHNCMVDPSGTGRNLERLRLLTPK